MDISGLSLHVIHLSGSRKDSGVVAGILGSQRDTVVVTDVYQIVNRPSFFYPCVRLFTNTRIREMTGGLISASNHEHFYGSSCESESAFASGSGCFLKIDCSIRIEFISGVEAFLLACSASESSSLKIETCLGASIAKRTPSPAHSIIVIRILSPIKILSFFLRRSISIFYTTIC